jgi:hypothetical protein
VRRPSDMKLLPLALAVGLLSACGSKKLANPDDEPTLKTLAGREVEVAADSGIEVTPEKSIAAYRKFL